MSYRPITDIWILARPKVKYYGAYPNGFLERGRALLGVQRDDEVLHVCGGAARLYPAWKRLCPRDFTLDLDASLEPDFTQDALAPLPAKPDGVFDNSRWPGILCDPPYTEADAEHYASKTCPPVNALLKNALASVRVGGRVGMLHYLLPQPPKTGVRFIACVGVIVGYNNRMRCFSVFEREADPSPEEAR